MDIIILLDLLSISIQMLKQIQVMFIATANDLRGIPAPLRDRMEIIPISGYTIEDKIPIATKHLFPKQLKLHGLDIQSLQITDGGFKFLGNSYEGNRDQCLQTMSHPIWLVRSLSLLMVPILNKHSFQVHT